MIDPITFRIRIGQFKPKTTCVKLKTWTPAKKYTKCKMNWRLYLFLFISLTTLSLVNNVHEINSKSLSCDSSNVVRKCRLYSESFGEIFDWNSFMKYYNGIYEKIWTAQFAWISLWYAETSKSAIFALLKYLYVWS